MMRPLLALACLAAAASCGRSEPPAPSATPPAVAFPAPNSASLPAAATDPTLGLGPKADRRRRPPAVIGGCGKACSTPEAAVSFLLVQLQSQRRVESLRPLFDWSLLAVDGADLGNGWAELWADPNRHGERAAQIDAWIAGWSTWVDKVTDPHALARVTSTGIRLRMDPANSQRAVVHVRHPLSDPAAGEPVWRWVFGQRGDEWLVVAIDHKPGPAQP